MSRIAYVNGRYLPHGNGAVHIEDRGFQFADGVYEVVLVHRGRMIDLPRHLQRLERSLSELSMDSPLSFSALKVVMGEMVRRNRLRDGFVYLQITRGVAPRSHAFPVGVHPSLVMTARRLKPFDPEEASRGVGVITLPEIRWKRRDIKSISLLPNCLGKQQALEKGAYEAWFVEEDGKVTEGTASNAWIVTAGGELVTRNAGEAILDGITRRAVLDLAREEGISFAEHPFTVDEATAAREAFLTSSTSYIKPVVAIDGKIIGDGQPGSLTKRLIAFYADYMAERGGAS